MGRIGSRVRVSASFRKKCFAAFCPAATERGGGYDLGVVRVSDLQPCSPNLHQHTQYVVSRRLFQAPWSLQYIEVESHMEEENKTRT